MLELGQARIGRRKGSGIRVMSITSGKGGVGKSSVAANLATTLGNKGHNVLLLDGDFSLANLDILFDTRARGNIHEVLRGGQSVSSILTRVAPNVDIIPASSGIMEMSQLGLDDKRRILEVMRELEDSYDVLLIDTGAGISEDVAWLNASASEVIVVATPEPTSITDAYALIKVLNQKHKLKDFQLLVNQVRNPTEAMRVYKQITSVADKFLNVSIDYMGHVMWDELFSQAIRSRKPMVSLYPNSKAAQNFHALADTIFSGKERIPVASNPQFFWKALLGHA